MEAWEWQSSEQVLAWGRDHPSLSLAVSAIRPHVKEV